jgi:DNA-binding response OmpR family regulator
MQVNSDKLRILVVDDDVGIVNFLRRGLVFEGYKVETAGDGVEALAKIRAVEPSSLMSCCRALMDLKSVNAFAR